MDKHATYKKPRGGKAAARIKERRFRPKMGRPSAEQVAAINRVILRVAAKRFLADGYARTSIEAIAGQAGISKPTLYSRYPDKESLLRAVIADRVATWLEARSKVDQKLAKTLEQRLKELAKMMMSRAASTEVRAFNRLVDGAPETARAHYDLLYSSMIRELTSEIKDLTRAEGRPARDPGRVASILLATLTGWLRTESVVRRVPVDEAIAFACGAIDLLIAGRSDW